MLPEKRKYRPLPIALPQNGGDGRRKINRLSGAQFLRAEARFPGTFFAQVDQSSSGSTLATQPVSGCAFRRRRPPKRWKRRLPCLCLTTINLPRAPGTSQQRDVFISSERAHPANFWKRKLKLPDGQASNLLAGIISMAGGSLRPSQILSPFHWDLSMRRTADDAVANPSGLRTCLAAFTDSIRRCHTGG
jgi:hypothetical protein